MTLLTRQRSGCDDDCLNLSIVENPFSLQLPVPVYSQNAYSADNLAGL